jgi:hypothetical protein
MTPSAVPRAASIHRNDERVFNPDRKEPSLGKTQAEARPIAEAIEKKLRLAEI